MRALISVGLVAVAVAGCRGSATVQSTTPVANLEVYRGLVVRGTRAERGRRWGRLTFLLERAAVAKIRARCAFGDVRVGRRAGGAGPDDVILDLTITRAFRGGSGLIKNQNQATVDVKMVLTDGRDDELVGSADIRGKSAGILLNSTPPEEQAITAVADSIAEMLDDSGCTEDRVARAPPSGEEVKPAGSASAQLVSEERTDPAARAEAENDEGKRLFRSDDVAGAKEHFEEAIRLHREPRYVLNLCLAEESLGTIDDAIATCRSVLAMKPDKALADKVKLRLRILDEKKEKGEAKQ